MLQRTATIDEHYKIHTATRNGTLKQREDKRTRDSLYESVHEWTR